MRVPFRLRLVLTAGMTALVLALLLREFVGSGDFARAVGGARIAWVVVAFCEASACVALGALRWSMVLGAMGYALPFWRSLAALLAVWPLAVVTPSRANELLRPLVVRDRVPLAAGTGSVLAEKAVDVFVLMMFAGAGAAVQKEWAATGLAVAGLVAEAAAVILVAARRDLLARLPVLRRSPRSVEDLFLAYESLRRKPLRLLAIAGVSLVVRFFTVAVTYALLVAAGAGVSFFATVTLWPAAMLVGLAPLTLAGMGTRDAAFIYLLGARGAHVDRAAVLAATMGYSAVAIWSFAVLAVPFTLRAVLRERPLGRS